MYTAGIDLFSGKSRKYIVSYSRMPVRCFTFHAINFGPTQKKFVYRIHNRERKHVPYEYCVVPYRCFQGVQSKNGFFDQISLSCCASLFLHQFTFFHFPLFYILMVAQKWPILLCTAEMDCRDNIGFAGLL